MNSPDQNLWKCMENCAENTHTGARDIMYKCKPVHTGTNVQNTTKVVS